VVSFPLCLFPHFALAGIACLTKLKLNLLTINRVLESIAAEKRLAESKYPVLSFRGGSASLGDMFARMA